MYVCIKLAETLRIYNALCLHSEKSKPKQYFRIWHKFKKIREMQLKGTLISPLLYLVITAHFVYKVTQLL